MPARRQANGNGKKAAGARNAYDQFKEFEGKRYTGMKVGRRHRWRYDPGEWTEKKVTPDKWEFEYAVVKRRAGKAPEGSGAPVGTAYRWYILAHQIVTKLDANSYTTEMAGLKYKLAHRRADKETWSPSEPAQRRRLVQLLRELIAELERAPEKSGPAAQPAAARSAPVAGARKAAAPARKKAAASAARARVHRPRAREKRLAA
jgi:hypothetical protein